MKKVQSQPTIPVSINDMTMIGIRKNNGTHFASFIAVFKLTPFSIYYLLSNIVFFSDSSNAIAAASRNPGPT